MGDGEVCGTDIEIRGTVCIQVDVIKDRALNSPVVENSDDLFFLASSPQIETAIEIATSQAVEYISKHNSRILTDIDVSPRIKIWVFGNSIIKFYPALWLIAILINP